MLASRVTVLRRTLPAVIALSIPFAGPALAQTGVMPDSAPSSRGQYTPPAPGAGIKTPAQAPANEPIDPDRLAALQRPRDVVAAPPKPPIERSAIPNIRLDQVMFDQPGDGALWASGNTYKARFDASGFTYIPKLGPSAPRNFPIAFTLQQVTVGEQTLALQPASPVRTGDTVRFDRGAITESYALALDSLEQTFRLDTRPAGAGDLVIRMAVQTDLPVTEDERGFVFAHDLGSVTYSRAVVVDAADRRTEVLTRVNDDGAAESGAREIEIELPASLLTSAAWPIVVDPILQTNVVEANFADRSPDVAYDRTTDTFCIVLEEHVSATDGDVWTFRLNGTTGALLPSSLSSIDITSTNWRRPKIANNDLNENYLVVAERGLAPNRVIWGRTVSTTSSATGSQVSIGDTLNYPGDEVHPDVGGDPDDQTPVFYCVVWQNEFSTVDHDVLARMVTPGGFVSGAVIEVDYSENDDFNPAISKGNNASEWAIAWDRRIFPSNHDIFAARLHWSGSINDPTFNVDTTTSDNRNPRVSTPMFDGSNAIVYEEDPFTAGDVYCRVMNNTTIAAGDNLTDLDGVTEQTRRPVVDANSSQFVVAYEEFFPSFGGDWDAYASTYCYLTSSLGVAERHRRLAFTSEDDSQLMVASKHSAGGNPDRALISWIRLYDSGVGDLTDAMYQIPASCCSEDSDHNGVIDVDDLIAVILSWGSCVNCNADIDGNTVVDVDDLVAVILAWGSCS